MVTPPSIGDLLILWGVFCDSLLCGLAFTLSLPLLYAPRSRVLFAASLIWTLCALFLVF